MIKKKTNTGRSVTILRILFGLIWVIDAVLKWLPGFNTGFAEDVKATAYGQPNWLSWWFHFWVPLLTTNPHVGVLVTAIIESLIAIALLIGFARRTTYITSMIFCFLLWGVGEGFGGPYVSGSVDIGAAIVYMLAFYMLYELEKMTPETWAVDNYIVKKYPWWKDVAAL